MLSALICLCCTAAWFVSAGSKSYGVDVTSAIHRGIDPNSYFGKRYNKMMEGCYALYNKEDCDAGAEDRMKTNLEQPSTQVNYTDHGFLKMKIPTDIYQLILKFYHDNYHSFKDEDWEGSDSTVNHWEAPVKFISLEDEELIGGGEELKEAVWDGMKPILEEWTGQELHPTSLYGIRAYTEGSVLATRKYIFIYEAIYVVQ